MFETGDSKIDLTHYWAADHCPAAGGKICLEVDRVKDFFTSADEENQTSLERLAVSLGETGHCSARDLAGH